MKNSWLIVADDLTGAADCAVAFAQNGLTASVMFDNSTIQTEAVAFDTGSRACPPRSAVAMQLQVLKQHFRPGQRLYKKIDSLLRGQPVAETAATIKFLQQQGHKGFAIIAPAFPALGRTTENSSVFFNGEPLEQTEIWQRDHSYGSAYLPVILQDAGMISRTLPLAVLRQGEQVVTAYTRTAMQEGYHALVCDAQAEDDLVHLARATLPMTDEIFWVGTGGLAQALAGIHRQTEKTTGSALPLHDAGNLTIVGSLTQISRKGARHLVATNKIIHICVPPEAVFSDDKQRLTAFADTATCALQAGQDVLLEIDETPDPDLLQGARLVAMMADAFRQAILAAGGLIATGGETAAAFLTAAGINGIYLIDEVEKGVPTGLTLGAHTIPIVTKAGSFGTEQTLANSLDFLHSIRKKGHF